MKIDTLFKSESGKLYVGTVDGDGKFSGHTIKDGSLAGKMQKSIPGTLVAKFVTPYFGPSTKALPLHADIKVEGTPTQCGLGQYLTSLTRAQQRNDNNGGDA